jgi:hypothetical protein
LDEGTLLIESIRAYEETDKPAVSKKLVMSPKVRAMRTKRGGAFLNEMKQMIADKPKRERDTHKGAINPNAATHMVAAAVKRNLEHNGRQLALSSLVELVVKDTGLTPVQVKREAYFCPGINRKNGVWSLVG